MYTCDYFGSACSQEDYLCDGVYSCGCIYDSSDDGETEGAGDD